MKQHFYLPIIIFLFLGCTEKQDNAIEQTQAKELIEKQMLEAENFFEELLSEENLSAIYPNRLVLSKNSLAEAWPAFFNAQEKEVEIKIQTECNNGFELSGSEGYFSIPSLEHKSFAVKLKATENTQKKSSTCIVRFIQNDVEIVRNAFVVVVQ